VRATLSRGADVDVADNSTSQLAVRLETSLK